MEIDPEQTALKKPEAAEEIQPETEHQVAEQREDETEKNAPPEPNVAKKDSDVAAESPEGEDGNPQDESPSAQPQDTADGDQSGKEASTKVTSTPKIGSADTKRCATPGRRPKRNLTDNDIISFVEETKNMKRLKDEASGAAQHGGARACDGGSAKGRGGSARGCGGSARGWGGSASASAHARHVADF
jgi:hypothetical protein